MDLYLLYKMIEVKGMTLDWSTLVSPNLFTEGVNNNQLDIENKVTTLAPSNQQKNVSIVN